jgi:hypothetical protein
MPEILEAIRVHGLALVALFVVTVGLVTVVRAFYKELTDRRVRAENLADAANALNDKLADNFKVALDELRKR